MLLYFREELKLKPCINLQFWLNQTLFPTGFQLLNHISLSPHSLNNHHKENLLPHRHLLPHPLHPYNELNHHLYPCSVLMEISKLKSPQLPHLQSPPPHPNLMLSHHLQKILQIWIIPHRYNQCQNQNHHNKKEGSPKVTL